MVSPSPRCTAARFRWPKTTRSGSPTGWIQPATTTTPHAALALQWALETELSPTPARSRSPRLRALAIEQLVRFADGVRAISRSRPWRCWATSARDRVERRWIDAIVAAQHGDGGWGDQPDEPSNDHTTTPRPVGAPRARPGRCTPDRGSRRARGAIAPAASPDERRSSAHGTDGWRALRSATRRSLLAPPEKDFVVPKNRGVVRSCRWSRNANAER